MASCFGGLIFTVICGVYNLLVTLVFNWLGFEEDALRFCILGFHVLALAEGYHFDSLAARLISALLQSGLDVLALLGVDRRPILIVKADVLLAWKLLEEATVEIFVGILCRSEGKDCGLGHTNGVRADDELDVTGLLDSLELVGGLSARAGTDGVALDCVLAVEAELVLADDHSVAVLSQLAEDDFASFGDVDDFPLVHERLVRQCLVFRGAHEAVLPSRVHHFLSLTHRQSDLILGTFVELFLDDDRARLDDIGVVAYHVKGQFELASRWVEVFV